MIIVLSITTLTLYITLFVMLQLSHLGPKTWTGKFRLMTILVAIPILITSWDKIGVLSMPTPDLEIIAALTPKTLPMIFIILYATLAILSLSWALCNSKSWLFTGIIWGAIFGGVSWATVDSMPWVLVDSMPWIILEVTLGISTLSIIGIIRANKQWRTQWMHSKNAEKNGKLKA